MSEERQQILQAKISTEIVDFRNACQTIQLATVNERGSLMPAMRLLLIIMIAMSF